MLLATEVQERCQVDRPCQVAVFAQADDPGQLGELLATEFSLNHIDAMQLARAVPGILPLRLTQDEAEHLVEKLRELGLTSEIVSCIEIPQLKLAEDVHHVRCTPAGLEIIELHGSLERVLPWDSVELVAVGQLPDSYSRHYVEEDTILTAARRTPAGATVVRATPGPELWVICRNPVRSLRIHHELMNYEYLDDRRAESSTVNFRTLVEDVVRYANHAFLPPATRAYLANGPVRLYTCESEEEFERLVLLQLLIHRKIDRGHGDISSPTQGSEIRHACPTIDIYHCVHCGTVSYAGQSDPPPDCCGEPMDRAIAEPI